MISKVQWEKRAQIDREAIFNYLLREAGLVVAGAYDEKIISLINLIKENPYAGLQIGRIKKNLKLIVPHFPFIIVYATEHNSIHIIRILHTSRKITALYSEN